MSLRLKQFLGSFFLAAVLIVSPVMAQEAGHEGAKSHEGGGEHGGMEVWKWANFAILAAILGYLISKNVGPMLVARSAEIREGLVAGEKAKAEADARAAAVNARLASLEKTIAGMQAEARLEREREAGRIRQDTQKEMVRLQRHAEMEIESSGKLARLELKSYAGKLALDLAEQKLRARMSPETETLLLNRFLNDVSSTPVEARQ
ncbi:MAG: H+-transporting two-sector ATPase, subunit [Bryobacterales bacterium]|nr:H+-transporting two-sector ATPase, subunit [Bryobacterales bacterium]